MINVMISNAGDEYLEYQYAAEDSAETSDDAITFAVEEYIETKLGGFDSALFPIAEDLWTSKITAAVQSSVITIQDKIKLLNSICRRTSFEITKVFVGYDVKYPPIKLRTPEIAISAETGNICWPEVANATGYKYTIDDEDEVSIDTTLIEASALTEGQMIQVKAVGNGIEYLDSDFATLTYIGITEV